MKRTIIFLCALLSAFSFTSCKDENGLKYEKCVFTREEYYDNWVVKNYPGVSANIIEANSQNIVIELVNQLDNDIKVTGWSRVYMYKDNIWYCVSPAKDTASTEPYIEETKEEANLKTVLTGNSKEFTCDFTEIYKGELLPEGNYRISISFSMQKPTKNDTEKKEFGKAWMDFEIN